VKDHLATREVAFDSINVVEESDALDELKEMGALALPVLARGSEHVIGLDMDRVRAFVGSEEPSPRVLPAAELVHRVEQFVPAVVRFASQLPTDRHDQQIPGRNRTYLGLANHIVAHVEIFLTLADGAAFTLEGVDEDVLRGLEREIHPPQQLGVRAGEATSRLRGWLETATPDDLDRVVATFFGDQTVHALLSSCAYSVAQHTRQLMVVLEMLGIEPSEPVGPEAYAGLPMPAGVWG
jgi:hypothetical protein